MYLFINGKIISNFLGEYGRIRHPLFVFTNKREGKINA